MNYLSVMFCLNIVLLQIISYVLGLLATKQAFCQKNPSFRVNSVD